MTDTISREAVIDAIASVLLKGERPFSPVEPLLIAINAIPSQPTQSGAPKPDPLVEVLQESDQEFDPEWGFSPKWYYAPQAKAIRAALEARGLEIRSKNDDE
jgi:hypothetical protein